MSKVDSYGNDLYENGSNPFVFFATLMATVLKKNLNASEPSEHPPQVEECLKVQVGKLAVETKTLHGIKRVPQCNYIGSTEYNIGEKPSVLLYTYINLHAGTPKPQSFLSKSPGLQCSNMVLYGLREELK